MKPVDDKASARAATALAAGVLAWPLFAASTSALAAAPLYVLGPEAAVGRALSGESVRACAPAVVSLPESFKHLRTPPEETTRAVALEICEVMIVGPGEVEQASRSLRELDVAVQVAPLGGSPSGAMASDREAAGARLDLASTGPSGSLAATPSEEAEALFYQAFEALQQNRTAESIALFERGLRMSPTNHFALFYLASAYEIAGEPGRARPLYERVTSLAPDSPQAAQSRERLATLRAAGVAASGGSGRFSGGIFIDPASPSGERSIRDVFERSPMAAGEGAAPTSRPQRSVDLPPPPTAGLAARPSPRIEAPAVPAPEPTVARAMPAPEAREERRSPGADPSDEAAAALRSAPPPAGPRLSSRPESTGIGTGRLPTRMGAPGRLPASGNVEATAEGGEAAARPERVPAVAAPGSAPASGRVEPAGTVEEARLSAPSAAVDAAVPQGPVRIELGKGAVYLGPVEAGRPHGRGRITYPDGSTYEGRFEAGHRSGPGVLASSEGWRYEGEFRNGRFNGHGTLTFADGSRYEGEFREGERTGDGIYTWAGGARYEGVFEAGVIVGPGVYVAADGSRYDGEFAEGRRSGNGTVTFPDGRTYVGPVANGVPQGRGSFYWPDGRRFAGLFRNGSADGAGVLVHPDGRSESGVWESEPWMVGLSRVSQ